MINVVHICASDILGGAARAAFRLHRSFYGDGRVTSRMLVRGKASEDGSVFRFVPPRFSLRSFYEAEIRRRLMDIRWSRFITPNQVMHSRADIRTGLLAGLNELPCDLVHLHWLGINTLSVEEIGAIGKPVVWTLHDMWAFCGAEHYVPDGPDARFRSGYYADNRPAGESGPDMNRSVWNRKQKSWMHSMTLVAPSLWMADCAARSTLCSSWPVHCIPNPLDLERWKPLSRCAAKTLLGLPQDKQILLFGAIGGEKDPRKGADLLRLALQELRTHVAEVHLAVFGQSEPEDVVPFAYPVTYLGRLQDEFSMVAAYNAADVMLVPSRQDNLPQTAVEAHACGVPVVAFDVGGLADIVVNQRTGHLIRPYDTRLFAEAIAQLLQDHDRLQQMSRAARVVALEKFAVPVVAQAYAKLYQKVLDQELLSHG